METTLDHRKLAGLVLGTLVLVSLGSILDENLLLRVECISHKLMGKARTQVCSRILQDLVHVKHRDGKNRPFVLPLNHTQQLHQLKSQAWEEMLDNAATTVAIPDEPAAQAVVDVPRRRSPTAIEYGGVRVSDLLAPAQAGLRLPSLDTEDLLPKPEDDEEKGTEAQQVEPNDEPGAVETP